MIGIILIIIWLALTALVWRSEAPIARSMRPRLITLLGVVTIWGSFFSLPWVQFDFTAYLDESRLKILTENIGFIGNLIHADKITDFLDIVFNEAFLNGLYIQASPFLGVRERIDILVPMFLALFAFVILPWTVYFRGRLFTKVLGIFLSVGALLSFFLLAGVLNEIDALGTTQHAQWALVAALLGVHIGAGPLFTLGGLLLLFAGGIIELFDSNDVDSHDDLMEMEAWT